MSDIFPIRQALELGYIVYWNDNHAWFRHSDDKRVYTSGPFQTLEDAAYAALSDHENIQAIKREQEIWDAKDIKTNRSQD